MEFNVYENDSLLVGDSEYAVSRYLMTPLGEPNTPAKNLYNESKLEHAIPLNDVLAY